MFETVLDLRPTAIRLHCGACGEALEFFGGDLSARAATWMSAHWQPTVDEVDFATDGGTTTTWRAA